MRAEGGSPNLINGVSRQPHEVRLTSQLEESVNQFPTVTRGLVPRNPAIAKGIINSPLPENATIHLIDRDDTEQYVVTISPFGVQVHDLEGKPKIVNAPTGYAYLAGAASGDLEALTVADHTFIVNKKVVAQADSATTAPYESSGLIHIVQGDYFTEYAIVVDGTKRASYLTDGGPYDDSSAARSAERGARTNVIATQLLSGAPPPGITTVPANASSYLRNTLGVVDWQYDQYDNVIYIKRTDGSAFTLEAAAGTETKMRAHKEISPDLSELPRKAPHGFRLTISGDEDTDYDDYYVVFDHPPNAANGRWKETLGPGIPYRLDPRTMPHLLVREADGSFTFKQATWANREVGDLDTNPWPSFVGHTIDGMVFFKNRVGFISGEAISMSRHGDFFNFFIESVLAPLDTDPVDCAISYPEVSDIHHAVPFSGELIMFTASVPFRLAGGDTFTPKSANFEHVISNRTSSRVRPVVAGNYLYFVNDAASGCFVHEFSYDREVGVKAAPTITDHVNGYIPSGVFLMEADEDLKILALVSQTEPNTIYVYKWLWIGTEKAQSAWQKWTIPDPVVGLRFYGEELIVVTSRPTSREVLSINCHEAWLGGKAFPAYLDRRVEVLGTYNAPTDTTTFVLPYHAEGASLMMRDGEEFGAQPTRLSYAGNYITVRGDWGRWAYAGWEYESYGYLSQLLYRRSNRQGGYANASPGIITTLANVTFDTHSTAFLGVDVERDYRAPYSYDFSAALVGTKTGTFGSVVLGEVKKPVSVMAKSEDARIRFGNRGPYPYAVMSYAWTGSAVPISY